MNAILPLERRAAIAQRLADGQTVTAALLAAEFAVSEDAVRRDLRALAARRSRGRMAFMRHDNTHKRA